MTWSSYRRLLPLARYGLCVAAAVFLYRSVTWYDYVYLKDARQTRTRLLDERGGVFLVWQDGQAVEKRADEIQYVPVGEPHAPRWEPHIEYGIRRVLQDTDHALAWWSVLMFAPVPFLCAVRLIWMLAIQQVPLSFWNATKFTFAGNFFNFALPGTTGGDVVKAYYITRFTHRKTEAVTTIFLDRAIGLLSLVLMAGAMIVFTRDPSQFAQLAATLALICAGLAVGAVIVFSRRIRRALRLRELVARLPLSEQLHRVGQATLAMRQHKLLVVSALLITFLLQGIALVSAVVMAWALNMEGNFSYFFIYIAIGFLVAALPTTPQALGVMESAYVVFFTYGGQNAASPALALALAVRLIQLVWSLPGVLVPLLGAHLPSRAELQQLEQAAAAQPAEQSAPAAGDVVSTAARR